MAKKRRAGQRVTVILPVLLLVVLIAAVVLTLPTIYTADAIVDSVTMEAGESLPDAEAFRAEGVWGAEQFPLTYAKAPSVDTSAPGKYTVLLTCMGKTVSRTLYVQDTVAPTAVTKSLTLTFAVTPEPEEFLESVTDVTAVTAAYVTAPDFSGATEQTVQILLTDASGNTTTVDAALTLDLDVTAPTITGVKDITLYAGDTVSYRSGVTVEDDRDENPTLTVETGSVDLSAPGEYTATYIVTDESGNETRQEITVTVLEMQEGFVSLETIDAAVEEVLSSIITDDMTTIQQVRAIYDYIRSTCVYAGQGERDDYLQAGYLMLTRHSGDCYNYFAAGKLLLEALEIPNIDVVKVKNYDSDSMHYWSLVSVDGGETYYHLDMTPRKKPIESFLLTDAELDAYSSRNNNCYNRDTSLYPATPEEGPE